MTTIRDLPNLSQALNKEAWDYLLENARGYADAVLKDVQKGATPTDVYHFMMSEAGSNREPLARRCKQAAQFLIDNKDAS